MNLWGKLNTVLDKYNIKKFVVNMHAPNAKNKMSMIERFNFTILSKITKYMTRQDSVNIDVIEDIINNYNHSFHSKMNKKPRRE